MTFEIAQWMAQILLGLVLLVVVVIDARRVGSWWISILFFIMLVAMIIRRVDDLAAVFGYNIVSIELGAMLSWAVLIVMAVGKWNVYRRAKMLKESEEKYQAEVARLKDIQDEIKREKMKVNWARVEQLELLRARDERGHSDVSWDNIALFRLRSDK